MTMEVFLRYYLLYAPVKICKSSHFQEIYFLLHIVHQGLIDLVRFTVFASISYLYYLLFCALVRSNISKESGRSVHFADDDDRTKKKKRKLISEKKEGYPSNGKSVSNGLFKTVKELVLDDYVPASMEKRAFYCRLCRYYHIAILLFVLNIPPADFRQLIWQILSSIAASLSNIDWQWLWRAGFVAVFLVESDSTLATR